jgi:hypothetical protein
MPVFFSCAEDSDDDSDENAGGTYLDASNIDQGDCSQIAESFFEYQEKGYNESFTFAWDPAGVLSVNHEQGCYNCEFAAHPIYRIEEDAIIIIERSQEDFTGALCNCSMGVAYDLTDVPPGIYDVYLKVQYLGDSESQEPELLLQESIYLPDHKEETYGFTVEHTSECI